MHKFTSPRYYSLGVFQNCSLGRHLLTFHLDFNGAQGSGVGGGGEGARMTSESPLEVFLLVLVSS